MFLIYWTLASVHMDEPPIFIKTNHEKMVPKHQNKGKEKEGTKQGGFTYNYTSDTYCDLKLLALLQNLKKICGGVLF